MKTRWLLAGLVMALSLPSDVRGQFAARQTLGGALPRTRGSGGSSASARSFTPDPRRRAFVESPEFGDDAALALLMCSRNGRRAARGVSRDRGIHRPSPGNGISSHHRPAGLPGCGRGKVIQHSAELADPDCADEFLTSPLEYSLALKPSRRGGDPATRATPCDA